MTTKPRPVSNQWYAEQSASKILDRCARLVALEEGAPECRRDPLRFPHEVRFLSSGQVLRPATEAEYLVAQIADDLRYLEAVTQGRFRLELQGGVISHVDLRTGELAALGWTA